MWSGSSEHRGQGLLTIAAGVEVILHVICCKCSFLNLPYSLKVPFERCSGLHLGSPPRGAAWVAMVRDKTIASKRPQ